MFQQTLLLTVQKQLMLSLMLLMGLLLTACGGGGSSGTASAPPAPPAPPAPAPLTVYLADQETNEVYELYRSDTGVKLNAPLVLGGSVRDFVLTPDNTAVVYRADQDIDGVIELYRVELATPGVSSKLNPALAAGQDVDSGLVITQDSATVIYRSDEDITGITELYRVELATPGVSSKLNPALAAGQDVEGDFAITPDGTAVVYRADQDMNNVVEFYRVALATPGVSSKLNGVLVVGGGVDTFTVIN